jgi:hypothetical protein
MVEVKEIARGLREIIVARETKGMGRT